MSSGLGAVAGRVALLVAVAAAPGAFAQPAGTQAADGERIYAERCAGCHDTPGSRAPARDVIEQMSVARILRTMDFGAMMSVTYMLDRPERLAVAGLLGVPDDARPPPPGAVCGDAGVSVDLAAAQSWNGWSPRDTNTRFQADPGIPADRVGALTLRWAFGFPGDVNAFAPPAVFGDDLFVGSAGGLIYALDTASGCIRWQFQADGPVRTAARLAPLGTPRDGARHAVFFGDQSGGFYALGAETGRLLWRARPEPHESTKLTGAALTSDGVVYVPVASWEESRPLNPAYACCTFRGSLAAYGIDDGALRWQRFLVEPAARRTGSTDAGVPIWGPSGAGTWSAPTLDTRADRLYVTTGNNYTGQTALSDAVVAIDRASGEIRWSQQLLPGDEFNLYCRAQADGCPGPDYDFGASAVLTGDAAGERRLVVGQKSGMVFGLDPDDSGRIIWQTRVGEGGINGGVLWGMASDGVAVYAAVSDLARQGQPDRDAFDPRPNGVDPARGGGLTALSLQDGRVLWHAVPPPCPDTQPVCSPAQPAAVTAMPGVVFAGSVDGHLRAYSSVDGSILWEFDTARDFSAVNGVAARGGSLDGDGPVIAGGMLFVTSGYGRNGGMPGNVLLAFGLPAGTPVGPVAAEP